MKLTTLLKRDWIESDELADAVAALQGGANDEAQHELLVNVWVQLAKLIRSQPVLFEALCRMPA